MPRPPSPPITKCNVTDRCPRPAWTTVTIGGTYSYAADPIDTCRGHATVAIGELMKISHDVRVYPVKKVPREDL